MNNDKQKSLEKMFSPQSVAVVGATEKKGKIGNIIASNLLDLGYGGEIFFVNPKHKTFFEKKSYKSLVEIDNKIDLAIIAVPAKFVNQIVSEAKNKVRNFVVISAGFAETNSDGKKREEELSIMAKKYQLNILGPNCLGFINPRVKLNASFASDLPEQGGISLISQSGALMVAMMDKAKQESLKFSQIISVGNKMQLDEVALLRYLESDQNTKVIAIYLEGIKNGRELVKTAKKINKPIVILKAGKSEKTLRAIASHTGSLAGGDEIVSVAFAKAGILRVQNLEEFFNTIKFISNYINEKDNTRDFKNSVIVTNAGGPGVLATDIFAKTKLQLIDLSSKTKNALQQFLPMEASVENPIDLLGDADESRYEQALEILFNEKELDTIFCLLTAQDQTPTKKIAQVLVNFSDKSGKKIIPIFIGAEKINSAVNILEKNNLPNFSFPKMAIKAVDRIYSWQEKRKELQLDEASVLEKNIGQIEVIKKSQQIIKDAIEENRKALLFAEATKVMRNYNIPTVDFVNFVNKKLWGNFSIGKLKFPVVLKIDSDKVLHKTDRQGLILNIDNNKELRRAIKKMWTNFPDEKLLTQSMIASQVELILGFKRDPTFGATIVFGLGGIYTEVFKMVDFMLLPLTRKEIKRNILQSKINFLFQKTRGKIVADIDEMTDLIFNFSCLAEDLQQIKEIDINPLLIDKDGKFLAIDLKIMI